MSMMFPQPVKDDVGYSRTLEFFERLLRHNSPCRLEQEYPLVFSQDRRDQIFVIEKGQEIHAGLATLIREIEIEPEVKIRALFVGSVVTDPQHRQQGFQRQLFHGVEEAAERWNIDVIVLWSNQMEFYRRLGFELGGLQASWRPQNKNPISVGIPPVRIVKSGEIELTQAHYQAFSKKTCRVQRTFEEMKLLWRIPEMRIAHTDRAYALCGKGEDFQRVIHEWAGPADEVIACFEAIRLMEPEIKILSPGILHDADERRVVHALEESCFESRLEYLGLFKPLTNKVSQEGLSPEDLRYPFFIWGLDSI